MTAEDSQSYKICANCRKPSQADREFCQHCWSRKFEPGTIDAAGAEDQLKRVNRRHRRLRISKRLLISGVFLVVAAVCTIVVMFDHTDVFSKPPQSLTSDSADGQWSMYQHDLAHSGAVGTNIAPLLGQVAWTFPTGGGILSTPAVAAGKVFFGSEDGNVYALDAVTGVEVWKFPTGSFVDGSPVVAYGTVYVGSNDGNLYALDAATGEKKWSYNDKYPITGAPAFADWAVYFGGGDGNVYALDARTGKKIWSFAAGDSISSSPVVNRGILYIGASSGKFYALDAQNGKFRLDFNSGPVYAAPAVSGDTVYFNNFTGVLFAMHGTAYNWLFEDSLRPMWSRLAYVHLAFKPPQPSGLLWAGQLGNRSFASPAVSGNAVYLGVDNRLVAFDAQKQSLLWMYTTGNSVSGTPAIGGSAVYFGSDDGFIYAVNAADGSGLWQVKTGGKVQSSPALANGLLYIGSADGNLYAIK